MLCKVEGCGRDGEYKAACLCSMHYHRIRRTGEVELRPRTRIQRFVGLGGYVFVYAKGHPLLDGRKGVYVREHRKVVFDDIGPGPMACELCGKGLTWDTAHIDHIDEVRQNNARGNLRPTCNACNTQRGRDAEHTYSSMPITFEGVTLTAHEWARDPRVSVNSTTIRSRLRAGQSVEQALFGAKVTHNGKKVERKRPYKPLVYYECEGKTLTLGQWAREPGVSVTAVAIKHRLRKGWGLAEALFTPSTERARANQIEKQIAEQAEGVVA